MKTICLFSDTRGFSQTCSAGLMQASGALSRVSTFVFFSTFSIGGSDSRHGDGCPAAAHFRQREGLALRGSGGRKEKRSESEGSQVKEKWRGGGKRGHPS